jgi:hypothetical protein
VRITELEAAVISVESARKINTDDESPRPSRVKMPVIPREGLLYAPGVFVVPPNSTPVTVPPRLSDKALDAAVNAVMDNPPRTVTPDVLITPVGAVASPTPMSEPAVPVIPDDVALVTAEFARTPYVDAVPMLRGASAACAALGKKVVASTTAKELTVSIASKGEVFLEFLTYSSILSMVGCALCSAYCVS